MAADLSDMREQIAAALAAERELFSTDQPDEPPSSSFVRACLYNNERGDGILFARLHRGKFIQVKNWGKAGVWLQWCGHHWRIDKKDAVRNAVEEVAQVYLAEAMHTKARRDEIDKKTERQAWEAANEEHKLYMARVRKLRSVAGAKNCLEWSTTIGEDDKLAIISDEIDLHPWLLACRNGVIDLRTGKFSPGRPDDYLLRAVPIDWQGIDATCPRWDAFIDEIHQHDKEIIAYLDRLFGYTLTGLTTHHFVGLFLGEGRNGKGTMFETLRWILGDLAWNISPELLIEQKNARNSAGPSPDLISMQGRRMIIASESDDNRRISGQQVKRLTGADTIVARAPHDRDETNITPTWKLFFYTNNIPKGMAADFALSERLVYLVYPLKFVTNPDPSDPMQRQQDPELPAQLKKEGPGILARYVRGCLAFQEAGGLFPPPSIRTAVADLQRSEDTIRQFVEEVDDSEPPIRVNVEPIVHPERPDLLDHEVKVSFKSLYSLFCSWYADNISESDKYRPSKKAVSAWLEKHGFRRSKPCGIAHVHGIRLRVREGAV
ncbi:MAG: hypothetical protein EOL86_09185 [Deltaproteobacteria bacterium]|nr:hypothetical protein [Deltaproteobacteria bacterium]